MEKGQRTARTGWGRARVAAGEGVPLRPERTIATVRVKLSVLSRNDGITIMMARCGGLSVGRGMEGI